MHENLKIEKKKKKKKKKHGIFLRLLSANSWDYAPTFDILRPNKTIRFLIFVLWIISDSLE